MSVIFYITFKNDIGLSSRSFRIEKMSDIATTKNALSLIKIKAKCHSENIFVILIDKNVAIISKTSIFNKLNKFVCKQNFKVKNKNLQFQNYAKYNGSLRHININFY